MRSRTFKIFIVILGIIFFADDVDVDVMLAPLLNTVFHTTFNAINRDLVNNGEDHQNLGASSRTIASTNIVAVDEDSPTTLDTAFPNVRSVCIVPESKTVATSPTVVKFNYLTLHTFLI
ncbi:MAG TPA: hypothetical protein VFJ29_07110 [Candidatus Kapabacteria bacterium]|nr:hypothetical protein [Candidatus Kapabacteria bacterium]